MNIRDVLKSLNVPFAEHGSSPLVTSGWLGLECPRCGKGTGKKGLGVHIQSLKASCWKCSGYNLVAALADITGKPYGLIKDLLGGLVPEPLQEVPKGKLELPPHIGDLLPAHRKYLQKRGFDPDELAERWGVKGIGPLGVRLAWRLFLPITDARGTVVSWTTRAIGDVSHGERYRGASALQSSVPRGEILFGAQHARHAVVVTEGPFDAFAVGVGGVATAGVGFSRAQVLQLSAYPTRLICFDSEPIAQKRARDLATMLACFPGDTSIVQLSGKDPASSPKEEIRELRKLLE